MALDSSGIDDINWDIHKQFLDNFNLLMKPTGSLGKLETIGAKIAGIKNNVDFTLDKKAHVVFASDNGIVAEGISSCPKEYTRIVSESILSGHGAVGILARTHNVVLTLVDIGIDGEITRPYNNLILNKINYGTKNILYEAAMTKLELEDTIKFGFNLAKDLSKSYDIISCGEMGIGNTSTSAIIIYSILEDSIDEIVGRGGGLSDEALLKKVSLVKIIAERCKEFSPLDLLKEIGGFDIAAMVGFYLGAAESRIPVILDGYISCAAALLAYKINPLVKNYMIASHLSGESGVSFVLKYLELEPMLNLDMRLGEGTGAILAYPILDSIMPLYNNMRTEKEIYKLLK